MARQERLTRALLRVHRATMLTEEIEDETDMEERWMIVHEAHESFAVIGYIAEAKPLRADATIRARQQRCGVFCDNAVPLARDAMLCAMVTR